jgi:two-component system sensor histidine kinase/response regulator
MTPSAVRVLLVEDNPDDADVLSELIAEIGAREFSLLHVESLRQALPHLENNAVDLVLLDLSLPDCHGRETVTRALAHAPNIPIIVLTGLDDERLGMDAVQAGAQDYLVKSHVDGRLLTRCMRYAIERYRLLAEKTKLIEELGRSNTIKTHFAATMSHELRNTLGVIIMLSELVLQDLSPQLRPEHRQTMQLVNDRAKESLQLIQATLELTRSEATHAHPEAQDICVAELIDQIARDTMLPAQRSDLRIEWQVASALPTLHSDPVKLKMVLKNLLGNAMKFTDHGNITVAVTAENGGLRFSVADTGVGIPPDQLSMLFEPFWQGHGNVSRQAGAAGLGLYIVRRLVEMLGGTIAVDSAPGHGSTFSVRIPLTPPAP